MAFSGSLSKKCPNTMLSCCSACFSMEKLPISPNDGATKTVRKIQSDSITTFLMPSDQFRSNAASANCPKILAVTTNNVLVRTSVAALRIIGTRMAFQHSDMT